MPKENGCTSGCTSDLEKCNQEFGTRLRMLREEEGLSRKQLASELGVAVSSLQNYEEGRFPKGDILLMLSLRFGCSLDWLVRGVQSAKFQNTIHDENLVKVILAVVKASEGKNINETKKAELIAAMYKLFSVSKADINVDLVKEFVDATISDSE